MSFHKSPVHKLVNDHNQREYNKSKSKDELNDILSRACVKKLNITGSIGIYEDYLENIDSQSYDVVAVVPHISEIRESKAQSSTKAVSVFHGCYFALMFDGVDQILAFLDEIFDFLFRVVSLHL